MPKSAFVPNKAGIAAFLKSQEVASLLRAEADGVAARAGPGFEVQVNVGRDRVRATVMAATREARLLQAREHVLEEALGVGGMRKFDYTTRDGRTIRATQAQIDNWTKGRR